MKYIFALIALIAFQPSEIFSAEGIGSQNGNFGVQLSSSLSSEGELNRLNSLYKLDYPIVEYYINGRYKYVTGSFADKKDAEDYLKKIYNEFNIQGIFIVFVTNDWKQAGDEDNIPDETVDETIDDDTFQDENLQNDDSVIDHEDYEYNAETVDSSYVKVHLYIDNKFPQYAKTKEVQKQGFIDRLKNIFKRKEKDTPQTKEASQAKVADKEQETVPNEVDHQEQDATQNITTDEPTTTDQISSQQQVSSETSSDTASNKKQKTATKAKVARENLPFPKNIIGPIVYVIETTFNSNRVIIIAVILIFYFQLTFALLVIFIIISRFIKSAQEKKKDILREKYQNIIADYLFSDESENIIPPDLIKARANMKSELLVDQVLLLHKNLTGETYDRLIKLYLELSLHQYSLNKLKSRSWHVVAKGIIELTQMNISSASKKIEELVDSSNEIIRMEAQLALIRLNKTHPFSFLDSFTEEFNEWEKLNIHNLIEVHKIDIPKFKQWLSSHNDSVVIFCCQMIKIYKQNDAYEELLKLLNHPNKEVVQKSIVALGSLAKPEASEHLKDIYANAYFQNKIRIIQSLGELGDESSLLFLENLLEDDNFDIRFESASAMKNIGGKGMMFLIEKMRSGDPELQLIIKHILDERI